MTYGVPYSFVPGTKAKADEVNANFIDVLNKIEDTNNRIDTSNTQTNDTITDINSRLSTLDSSKANLSLSNLNSTGKAMFTQKADASLLDGTWTSKSLTLVSNISLGNNVSKSYSLSSYLPSDNNVYDVVFSVSADVEKGSENYLFLFINTDKLSTNAYAARVTGQGSHEFVSNIFTLPVGKDRKVNLSTNASQHGTNTISVRLSGYRKVR